jgi:TetR/AcrR family transcriptional repressor of nem operon
MAQKKTDKDAVIEAALTLIRTKGYHHTSIADIAEVCGLLKGSIYHYFPGKQELALAALDRVIEDTRAKLFAPAADETVPASKRLAALGEAIEGYFIGREGGCLMGNLALEVGWSIPDFMARIRAYFADWQAALLKLLAPTYGEARGSELAEDAAARMQGAIMMMGITRDDTVFRRAVAETVALLPPEDSADVPAEVSTEAA